MDGTFSRGSEDLVPLDLERIGKELNISSTGDEMRLLECPNCHEHFIRYKRPGVKFAKCACGTKIELKSRWYD